MENKIILISGSPRSRGNTIQVLEVCAKIIEDLGVETELISLADKKILACTACYKCEEEPKCSLNDDLNKIINKIRSAKGLIIGTPIYFGTARGDLLNLVQRMGMVSICSDNYLTGKIGGPITIARHSGYTLPLNEILNLYRICKMIVPDTLYPQNVVGRIPGEALNDIEGINSVSHFVENVAKIIKENKINIS